MRFFLIIIFPLLLLSCDRSSKPDHKEGAGEVRGADAQAAIDRVVISPLPVQGMEVLLSRKGSDLFEMLDSHFGAEMSSEEVSGFCEDIKKNGFDPTYTGNHFRIQISYREGLDEVFEVPLGSNQGEAIYWMFVDCFGTLATQELFLRTAPHYSHNRFFSVTKR
jgi:hypothetical protein